MSCLSVVWVVVDTILVYQTGIRHEPQACRCQCGFEKAGRQMSQMQNVERQLREMILGLEIGPGERLTERWIESRFGASRTPVRAALLRLETEGLIGRDGRGWTVAPINLAELEQIAVYREAVEVAALRLTCTHADGSAIDVI